MAIILNEQKFVEDNIFKYEDRLNTQVSRFLDKSPVFVLYFHINVNDSTVDGGLKDVEELIGKRSPLRFQKIDNFPIYGIEGIMLTLEEGEEGLNSGYQGEAVILPNTIKPVPNDYFMIKHLQESYIFRVTGLEYDNIRPDNFYKIQYKLEYIDKEKEEQLHEQTNESYTCILQNIGTENNCLIQEEYYERLMQLDAMYDEIVSTYMAIFYNDRHNCLLGTHEDKTLFDPLMSLFINKHDLLNKKENLKTTVLSEGFDDPKRKILYEKSMYRFFERRDHTKSKAYNYHLYTAMGKTDSTFYRWHDDNVYIVDPTENGPNVLIPFHMSNVFKLNGPTESKYIDLMRKFIRKEEMTIYSIPLDLHEALLELDANEEFFFFTPILMYIIKVTITEFLMTKN